MITFFLLNPWGETLLLAGLGLLTWHLHRVGLIQHKAVMEIFGFLLATIVGFFIPGVFFFAAAVVYVCVRLVRARHDRRLFEQNLS